MKLIIRGPAGVGKTSYAKKLCKKNNSFYFSIDNKLEKRNLDVIIDGKIPLENFLKINKIIIKENIDNIVVDGNFYYEEQIQELENIGFKVITLVAPLQNCIERNKNRKTINEEAIKEVYELVKKIEPRKIINNT